MKAQSNRRIAFTLIELLVVISIVALLATLTAIYYPGFSERQLITRTTDQIAGVLLSAKQMAKRDGLPTGVQFLVDPTTGLCNQMVYIQQPDDIAVGQVVGYTTAPIPPPPAAQVGTQFTLQVQLPKNIFFDGRTPQMQVLPGDYIELYKGGVVRRISGVSQPATPPGDVANLTLDVNTMPLSGAIVPPAFGASNYRLILQPRPLSSEPAITLSDPLVIDMRQDPSPAANPLGLPLSKVPTRVVPTNPPSSFFEVLFAPSGAVIGEGTSSGQIVFWVRSRNMDPIPGNLIVGSPLLVTVQRRTGMLAVQPAAPGTDPYLFTRDGRAAGL